MVTVVVVVVYRGRDAGVDGIPAVNPDVLLGVCVAANVMLPGAKGRVPVGPPVKTTSNATDSIVPRFGTVPPPAVLKESVVVVAADDRAALVNATPT
jgi:hypothetical protein